VNRERGDVAGADDTADRQGGAELGAARIELVAEERRGERRVDEPRCDQVDAYRRELECEVPRERGKRGCERRDEREARRGAPCRS
jgi:hypothetical protein